MKHTNFQYISRVSSKKNNNIPYFLTSYNIHYLLTSYNIYHFLNSCNRQYNYIQNLGMINYICIIIWRNISLWNIVWWGSALILGTSNDQFQCSRIYRHDSPKPPPYSIHHLHPPEYHEDPPPRYLTPIPGSEYHNIPGTMADSWPFCVPVLFVGIS